MNDEADSPNAAPGGDFPVFGYVPSPDEEALWDEDLSPERRGWQPVRGDDLWRQVLPWKCERYTAELDGAVVEVLELINGAEPSWDWRTVSFWSTALGPGWRVHLRHPGRVDLIGPPRRAVTTAP